MKSEASETSPTPEPDLQEAVGLCRSDEAMLESLREIYEQADQSVADEVCMGGGMCCKFDLADHRLYVSLGELALLTLEPPPAPQRAWQRRCPYQVGPDCTAYARRPLGCRVYFCRKKVGRGADLQRLYERLHRQIRHLHQSRWQPYAYADMPGIMTQLFCSK
jgi:Fe-S-cluster containining protein